MYKVSFLLLVLLPFSIGRPRVQGTWPSPDRLVAFWPLDAEAGLDDISVSWNGQDLRWEYGMLSDKNGPFGEPRTSYSVFEDDRELASKIPFPLPAPFTISFYFFTHPRTNSGGIFSFWPEPSVDNRFGAKYRRINSTVTNFELWGSPGNFNIKPYVIIPDILGGTWNFFAITYDPSQNNTINVYSENGELIGSGQGVIPPDQNAMFHLGYSNTHDFSQGGMTRSDATACFMIYNTTLTPAQIRQLPEVCRTKGGTKTTTTPKTTTEPALLPWPRPEALLGFWPLNSKYQFQDIGPNRFESTAGATLSLKDGPFGDKETAMAPGSANGAIVAVKDEKLSVAATSFTVSLFFRRGGTGNGSIFEFIHKAGSTNAFQIRYLNETTIEVGANGASIAFLHMVQQKGAWTYLALVYDKTGQTSFKVYGKNGQFFPATNKPQLTKSLPYCNYGIRLGQSTRWKQGLQTSDAVSCLMVYNVALTPDEIRQAYRACRITHNSAPCGAPKLPLSAIPVNTMGAIVPSNGQFPYVAAMVSSGITCSATIIDAYWLITSSSCLARVADSRSFKVFVGAYDLSISESNRREHEIARFLPLRTPMEPRDVVLVELVEPIDFTNNYVNDACTLMNENVDDLKLDDVEFVPGWGKNGRSPVISQSLVRFACGKTLKDAECLQAWGNGDFTANEEFCFLTEATDKNVPCEGDEGAPLLAKAYGNRRIGTSDRLVQIGVYSKRDENCSPDKPGLFTKLSQWSKLISEKIACAVPPISYPPSCPQE